MAETDKPTLEQETTPFQGRPDPSRRGIAFDLFCGGGGLALGAEMAGFDITLGADVEPVHCATHHYNFGYGRALPADLSIVSGDDLRRAAGSRDDIDLITLGRSPDFLFGGPPCQGYSQMGHQDIEDKRNQLVWHFHRLVDQISPRYALMENVPGLLAPQFAGVLDGLLEAYRKSGYEVITPIRVLNAADFGVPQSRERVILLIYRRGERPPAYPEPTHARGSAELLLKRTPTVRDALAGLPMADDFPELLEADEVDASGHWSADNPYALYLRGLANDPEDLSYPRLWTPALLTCSKRTVHAPAVVERYNAVAPGGKCPGHNLVRLHPDRLSPTLRAGSVAREYDGRRHSAQTAARPIHPWMPRVITVREGARLHSIPDYYRLHSTVMSGFRQLGNSVPPLLARAVIHQIRIAAGLAPEKPHIALVPGSPQLVNLTDTKARRYFAEAA